LRFKPISRSHGKQMFEETRMAWQQVYDPFGNMSVLRHVGGRRRGDPDRRNRLCSLVWSVDLRLCRRMCSHSPLWWCIDSRALIAERRYAAFKQQDQK